MYATHPFDPNHLRAPRASRRAATHRITTFAAAIVLGGVSPALGAQEFVRGPGVGTDANGMGLTIGNLDVNPRPDGVFMAYDERSILITKVHSFRYRVALNFDANGVPTALIAPVTVAGFGEVEGAGCALADLDGDARPELILMGYTPPGTSTPRYARWKVGKDLDDQGVAASWTAARSVLVGSNQAWGADISVGQLDTDPRPDLLFMVYEDKPTGNAEFRYRIGYNLDADGAPSTFSAIRTLAGVSATADGAGAELADVDGNGIQDLVLFAYTSSANGNLVRMNVGYDLDRYGIAQRWSGYLTVDGMGQAAHGAGLAAAQLGNGAAPELLFGCYENQLGTDEFHWKALLDADRKTPYPGADVSGDWVQLTSAFTFATPALGGLDYALHGVMVDSAGTLRHAVSVEPGVWSNWTPIAVAQNLSFATDTAPVLLVVDRTLHVFARTGNDELLHLTGYNAGWSYARVVATGNAIRGRIAVTSTLALAVREFHVAAVAPQGVECLRIVGTEITGRTSFPTGVAAGIGSDGEDDVFIAVQEPAAIKIYQAQRGAGWTFEHFGGRGVSGKGGGTMVDVADVQVIGSDVHLAYVQSYRPDDVLPTVVNEVAHARFPIGRPYDGFYRRIESFAPGTGPARVQLINYRQKAVVAYRLPNAEVHWARLDSADPAMPWLGMERVGTAFGSGRPALAAHDFRPTLAPQQWGDPNYGDDLLCAVRLGQDPSRSLRVNTIVLSRAIMKGEIGRQLAIYNANLDPQGDPQGSQYEPYGPTPVLVSQDHRAFVTELGMNLWMLPNWFVEGWYGRVAERMCLTGNYVNNGRFDPPCSASRLPVIVKENGGIFVWAGAWQTHADNYIRIWEELGHYTAYGLGLGTASTGPTSADATRSNLPLYALQSAYTIFSERTNTCQAGPRCRGFLGIGGNYDNTGREHSFIYAVYYFVHKGDEFRELIAEDLAVGDNLLQRKYNWVRTYLFKGLEFGDKLTPIAGGGFVPYGSSCAGTRGLPTHSGYAANSKPRPGTTVLYRLRDAAGNVPATLLVGVDNTALGALPLPLDLGVVGAAGCSLYVAPADAVAGATDSLGRLDATISIPNDSRLIGAELFTQFLSADPAANSLGLTFTNGLATTIGS